MQDKRNYTPRQGYQASAVRRKRRRSTVNLYLTVAAAVFAALGSLLSVNVFFNLSSTGLEVNGCTYYTPEQIQAVGGLVPGQNLIRLNTEFIASRLKDNLAYIDDVAVVKNYPEGLTINITEAVPNAQIEDGGFYYTLSKSGRLLEIQQSERDYSLPLVIGYELKDPQSGAKAQSEDSQKTEILTELFEELDSLGFEKIVSIDITDRTDIQMNYDDRIEIDLGSSVDLDIKLTYILATLNSDYLPESYEGTLRYNSIDSGVSAIPKQADVPLAEPSSVTDSDSSADSEAYGTYGDGSAYGDSSSQGYSDYTYGYSDSSAADTYADGYSGYSDYGYSTDGYSTDGTYTGGTDYGTADTDYGNGTTENYNYGYTDGYTY